MRRHAIALSVLAAALVLGACGQDTDSTSEGSNTGQDSSAPSSKKDQPNSDHQRSLRYAECLRNQGLEVQDPAPGQARPRVSADADPRTLSKARKACRQYAPQSLEERKNNPEMRSAMLDLAECLREHGIDVADPGPNGLINFDAETRNDPRFDEAMNACGQKLSNQLGGKSGSPGSGSPGSDSSDSGSSDSGSGSGSSGSGSGSGVSP